MPTYNELLFKYKDEIALKDISSQTVKLFLFELCNENNIDLYMEMNNEAIDKVVELFEQGIKRILNDEPLNYVLGFSWFCGNKFIVNENVLVPRYETEELVYNVLGYIDERYENKKTVTLVDVGTGSGAIAISLKNEEEKLQVWASDISENALVVAKENAKVNNADVTFMSGDMLKPFISKGMKFDVIVSNPPYIPDSEILETSVVEFEPNVALFGGSDGLKFYQMIMQDAHKLLNENGMLAFEIGWDQKDRLENMARNYFPDAKVETLTDINGKDRMLFITL